MSYILPSYIIKLGRYGFAIAYGYILPSKTSLTKDETREKRRKFVKVILTHSLCQSLIKMPEIVYDIYLLVSMLSR